jgi:predicted kinase
MDSLDGKADRARRQPLLVLVAGAPASGKTTLARELSAALSLPLLSRDPITQALVESLGASSRQQVEELIPASFRVLYALVAEFLASGGVIAETNFHRGVAEAELRPLAAQAQTVLVHCHLPREESLRRFAERYERGQRHWSSFDAARITRLRAGQSDAAWDRAEPLDLDVPTLLVDTTNGYAPDLAAIAAFISGAS